VTGERDKEETLRRRIRVLREQEKSLRKRRQELEAQLRKLIYSKFKKIEDEMKVR